ncbi:hypothetical protein [Bradyrhizobium sp. 2S1]|uniref:hypothetical protein n=1 Tax=Bradyrhizobium sp. 2S1 TaxID=1404429 RepID=UPI00140CBB57|nr:hypothetical protein [Bradyrhizobium sp. 2S1]MCK7665616.1 hypothetical protein [Bradyrhizobium sp. 2S1]
MGAIGTRLSLRPLFKRGRNERAKLGQIMSRECEAASSSTPVIARLDRAIQYAAAYRFNRCVSGILDHPHARVMTPNMLFDS